MSIEIVFSFDTTGSMAPCLDQVRRNLENTIGSLFKELPDLKIGLIAHGDYCDARTTYVTKHVDLTSDLYTLTQFTRSAGRTGGGDSEECYELVLHEARHNFNWSLNAKKIFVLIGDDVAHSVNYAMNTKRLDWKTEAINLAEAGISVYTVQCLSRRHAESFYDKVAELGKGYHLYLDQFSDILNLIYAIVYKQVSPEKLQNYEDQVAKSGSMNRTLDKSFSVLAGRPRDAKGRFVSTKPGLEPVAPGRFQMLNIDKECDIRSFVQDHDLVFTPGKGFYEFTKSEEIQARKEIVLRDKVTGDMFSGDKARELLGIPIGAKITISPRTAKAVPYDVFVQSTSYNRKLKPGTRFLYEVDMAA